MASINGEDIALIQNLLNSCMIALDNGDGNSFVSLYLSILFKFNQFNIYCIINLLGKWFADCYTNDGTCTINKTGKNII
jgi:hypothetical protein